jgi:ABC-2 type transport system ATP-binding protein
MTNDAARFVNVSKRFGKSDALAGLTLAIPKGSVVGLLGRNGAGKSTALRCLVGLQAPDSGEVRILDRDPLRLDVETKRRIGFQSEQGLPFADAKVTELIQFCAPLYPDWDRDLEAQMLSRFGIEPKRRLKQHSLGQQRAVGLLLALCPRPELLILDEPAANLDAVVRREFLDAVLSLVAEEGRTVIFSSHILSDVERAADRVAIIDRGKLLLERSLDDLKESTRRVRFMFAGAPPPDIALPGVVARRRSPREILATVVGYDAGATARLASSLGADVEAHRLGLEDLFVDLVGGDADGDDADGAAA